MSLRDKLDDATRELQLLRAAAAAATPPVPEAVDAAVRATMDTVRPANIAHAAPARAAPRRAAVGD